MSQSPLIAAVALRDPALLDIILEYLDTLDARPRKIAAAVNFRI
jgi:hypothetical protein